MLPHKYQIYKTKMENVTKQHHIYIKQKWKLLSDNIRPITLNALKAMKGAWDK